MFSDLKKHVLIQHDLNIRPEFMIFAIRVHIRFETGGQQYCKSFVLRQQIRCAPSEQFGRCMWVVHCFCRMLKRKWKWTFKLNTRILNRSSPSVIKNPLKYKFWVTWPLKNFILKILGYLSGSVSITLPSNVLRVLNLTLLCKFFDMKEFIEKY